MRDRKKDKVEQCRSGLALESTRVARFEVNKKDAISYQKYVRTCLATIQYVNKNKLQMTSL